ncbi:MAG: PHP domain-containing protein [Chitinispirillaceae bacterium]
MHVKADLHIHSCLSPCGSLEMSPSAIVSEAKSKGLNAVALTDHNCARNAPVFARLCERNGLRWLVGMEITSLEEAHVLALFDSCDDCMILDQIIYEHLPDVKNKPEKWGDQVVVNEWDEIEQEVEKYLGTATDLPVDELISIIHHYNGLAIPSHIDKPVFSIVSQLGFLPPQFYDAIEISAHDSWRQLQKRFGSFPYITASDSHYLDTIGQVYTSLDIYEEKFTCDTVRACLRENRFRRVRFEDKAAKNGEPC